MATINSQIIIEYITHIYNLRPKTSLEFLDKLRTQRQNDII